MGIVTETSSCLVNRKQQRKQIQQLFANIDEERFAAMEFYGVGGLGKSRVLEIAKAESRKQQYPLVIIDMLFSDYSHTAYPYYDLLLRISDQIDLFSDFSQGRLLLSSFFRNGQNGKSLFSNRRSEILSEYYTRLSEALGEKPLILILDSVEHCPPEKFDWFGREFIAPLVLDDKLSSIVVFLAGRGPRIRESRWPLILKNATHSLRLDPFDFESTLEHIRALPPQGVYKDAASNIYALSNGHPYGTESIVSWLNNLGVNVKNVGGQRRKLANLMKEEVIHNYILSDANDWALPFLEIASHFRWFTASDLHALLEKYRPNLGKNQPIQWTSTRLVDLQKQPLHLVFLGEVYYKLVPSLRKLLHISYVLLHPEESAEIHLDISRRLEGQLHSDAVKVTEILYHRAQASVIKEKKARIDIGWFKELLEEHFNTSSSQMLEELLLLKNKLDHDDELDDLLSEKNLLVKIINQHLVPPSTPLSPFQLSHLSIEFTMPSEYRVSWFLADQAVLPTERVRSARRFDLDAWKNKTQAIGSTAFSSFLPSHAQKFIKERCEWAIQLTTNRVDIPWELLHDGEEFLCISRPLGRRPQNLKEPKRLPPREKGPLRALIVGNPTDDLPGAELEAKAIEDVLSKKGCNVDLLLTSKVATATEFVVRVRTQSYDLIHYAGHGYFDYKNPALSGLQFNDGPVYAEELERILNSKAFVFLSACEAGRSETTISTSGFLGEFVEGVATSVMLAGAIGCLGSIWKIGDEIAKDFALVFYRHLLSGETIGEAVRQARIKIKKKEADDFWKSWVLYGNPLQKLPDVNVTGSEDNLI